MTAKTYKKKRKNEENKTNTMRKCKSALVNRENVCSLCFAQPLCVAVNQAKEKHVRYFKWKYAKIAALLTTISYLFLSDAPQMPSL